MTVVAYLYSCECFNSHNCYKNGYVIADETELISSPAYLHIFREEKTNEEYCVISDSIGIPMPYLKAGNEFIVGTSRNIYFFDVASKITVRRSIKSPCEALELSQNRIIAICERDVVIISSADKQVLAEYEFDDIVTDYIFTRNGLSICLTEGKEP